MTSNGSKRFECTNDNCANHFTGQHTDYETVRVDIQGRWLVITDACYCHACGEQWTVEMSVSPEQLKWRYLE